MRQRSPVGAPGRRRAWMFVVALAGLASALIVALSLGSAGSVYAQAATPTPTPSTIVRIEPPAQSVSAGTDVVFEVRVDTVTDLGAYEFEIAYSDILLDYVSVVNGPFLGSSGRSVSCLPVQLDVGTVRYGCVTLGSQPGATGSGLLATVTFSTSCAGSTNLDFNLVGLSNTLGIDLPAQVQGGTADVTGGGACPTPTITPTPAEPTATFTPTKTSTSTPVPTATPAPQLCLVAGGPALCVLPISQQAIQGNTFNVQVAIDNVTNFGAYEFDLLFDDNLVSPVSINNAGYLGSTGRTAVCVSGIETSRVTISCSTLGGTPPGPTGSGIITNIVLKANTGITGVSALLLDDAIVTNISAAPVSLADLQHGSVQVIPVPPTATPLDTSTATATATITPGGPTTFVRIDPPLQGVSEGTDVVFDVTIEGVTDLGAYEFEIGFNPALLSFVQVQDGPFLGSTGGAINCIGPTLGFGTLRYGCVMTGAAGVTGTGVLATVRLGTSCGGSSALTLNDSDIANSVGAPIAHGPFNGIANVIGPSTCPTPPATATPTDTPTSTSTSTPTVTPGAAPDATVLVSPAGQTVAQGTNVVFDVEVDNVTDLGAFEFEVSFNSTLFSYVSVAGGPFLGGTGGTVSCPSVALGNGTARFGCIMFGAPGVSGSGVLATVTLGTFCDGSGLLRLTDVDIADAVGTPINRAIQHGVATVTGPSACPTPTPTPTKTPTPVPPTATPTGPTFTPTQTSTFTNTPPATATSTATRTPVPAACGTAGLTVCVVPNAQTVTAGLDTSVDVFVDNVPELGAFQFQLSFDPTVVTPLDVTVGSMLGSTGRVGNCLKPPSAAGTLQFSCVTLGATPAGATGNGVLAKVTLRGVAAGTSTLGLTNVIVTNVAGIAHPSPAVFGGSITVEPAATATQTSTPTTTNTPTVTNTPTATITPGGPTATATSTPTVTNTPTTTLTPTTTNTPANTATPTAAPGPLTLRVQPISQTVPQPSQAVVEIVVDNASNMGAFQFKLEYNQAVLTFQSMTVGPFLGSTGRSVICAPPSPSAGVVEFVCNTLGGTPAGPSGTGVIATATFLGSTQGISVLQLSDIIIADITGSAQTPVTSVGGQIAVGPPNTPTPTPTPGAGASAGFLPAASLVGGSEVYAFARIDTSAPAEMRPEPQAQGVALVHKDPSAVTVYTAGGPVVLQEWVVDAFAPTGIGGFELSIAYNPDVVWVDVRLPGDPFLASTGRTPHCFESYTDGAVRFSCATLGSVNGPVGSGVLAEIVVGPAADLPALRPADGNGYVTVIDDVFTETFVVDRLGGRIDLSAAGDTIALVRALPGDVNHDCVVTVEDQQRVANRHGAVNGMAAYNRFLDLEPAAAPDGDIDIQDLQVVYGRTGDACQPGVVGDGQPIDPTPTATSTHTPVPNATATSTHTPVPNATATSTHTPVPNATATSTHTPVPNATATHTPVPNATATHTPVPDATAVPNSTPTPGSPEATAAPGSTSTPTALPPDATPTIPPAATSTPTPTPTATPNPPNPSDTLTPTVPPPPDATGTPAATSTPLPADGVAGDADGDGVTTALDAAAVLQWVAGLTTREPAPAADVDRDGMLTAGDAALILQYVAGLIAGLPV